MKSIKKSFLLLASIAASLFTLPSMSMGVKVSDVKPTLAKTKDSVLLALATAGGGLAANFAMAVIEKFAPVAFGKFSPVVGGVGFVPYYVPGASDGWKAFGNGVVAAASVQAFKNALTALDYTGPGASILKMVNDALPGRGSFAPLAGYDGQSPMLLRGNSLRGSRADEILLGSASVGQKLIGDEMLSM